jgi:hypothetical protein
MDPSVWCLTGTAGKETGMKLGLGKECVEVSPLMLHGLNVGAKSFVGLTHWKLLDVRGVPSALLRQTGSPNFPPCRTGALLIANRHSIKWYWHFPRDKALPLA